MSRRYFCPHPIEFTAESPCVVSLEGPESHHLSTVMRVGAGDRLTLFDGSGAEFDAEVLEIQRRGPARLLVRTRDEVSREPPVTLTLGVALPKGDRQKVLVDMLTQIGVAKLVPLVTEHSVAAPKASGIDKLRRAVIEASKQCGRNRLMTIDEPAPLAKFFGAVQADCKVIAHPGDEEPSRAPASGSVAIAIGPEGGFSDEEVAAATAAGWGTLRLGKSILRIETAAIAAAAAYAVST
ncbi:Ribosomal RNA small subunit methyltransferase E [Botrimarina colliarenosi]|uniref:Ribosomal RNA small subunit methyltransferase E n=2 Tax=Botrimarina colliarenosi TaxID=2528001 RepID=A0A5C6AQV0_9BACT|nr:Ribosomal RNA small subunit methyltransferase E [Botrimarina colliarenosi]